MNKIIFRLSLLIAGLLVGASNVNAQVKTIADYPDSIIARYASLESRGLEVIPSSVCFYSRSGTPHLGGSMGDDCFYEVKLFDKMKSDINSGNRIMYGLYNKKNNPQVEWSLRFINFMKWRDSLKVEEKMSRFFSEIHYLKEFKKFFKIMKKNRVCEDPANITVDAFVQYVTSEDGKYVRLDTIAKGGNYVFDRYPMYENKDLGEQYVVTDDGDSLSFPGCDESVVKSYLTKYGLNGASFGRYINIRRLENCIYGATFFQYCMFDNPLNLVNPAPDSERSINGFVNEEVDYAHRNPKKTIVYSKEEVGSIGYDRGRIYRFKASIDGDTYEKEFRREILYDYNHKNIGVIDETKDMPYNDVNFRRFLARHFPTREEILSWKVYDNVIFVSKNGNDVVISRAGNDKSAAHFSKRWDGRWTLKLQGPYIDGLRDDKDSVVAVLDSTITLAMLPFIKVHTSRTNEYGGNYEDLDLKDISHKTKNKLEMHIDDPLLGVKFDPAFQAGLWVESSATPKYSCRDGERLCLDNIASAENVAQDNLHSYKLALGFDNSDPKNPLVVRVGIDSQKAEDLKNAYKRNEAARERREQAEDKANYIREKSKIYGMNQVKTFVNNGYLPFIGMSWSLFKNEYCDNWIFCVVERSDSDGYHVVKDSYRDHFNGTRWYYFYNNRLDHWVDRY